MSTAVSHVDKKGSFNRKDSKHRNFIKIGSETFPPEADRYHVHIALGEILFLPLLCTA
jgi:glutathionyl-hydroquinone reductase